MIGRPVGTGSAKIALTALALARLMRRWRRAASKSSWSSCTRATFVGFPRSPAARLAATRAFLVSPASETAMLVRVS